MKKVVHSVILFALLFATSCGSDSDLQYTNPIINNPTNAQQFKSVSGYSHTVAIKEDGTLWTCGYNANGELGNGVTNPGEYLPPAQIGTDTNWKIVNAASGGFHTLAIKTDGSLWGWGTSFVKAMGMGDVESVYVPTRIGTANDWKAISCSVNFSLALKNNGTLWYSGFGITMGQGAIWTDASYFVQLGSDTWKEISAGGSHGLAIRSDGSLWSWGLNDYGQLGNGSLANNFFFYRVGTDTDWKQIASAAAISMAIKNDGSLWTWGHNDYGQLGLGSNTDVAIPTRVGTGNDWKSIATGGINSYAVKTDGTLWGWGDFVSLGHFVDNVQESYVPVKISPTNDWESVDRGLVMYAKKTNGENWCWGAHITVGTAATSSMAVRPIVWQ